VEPRRFAPDDPDYPRRLTDLNPAPVFTATGPIPSVRAVAIVGSRQPFAGADHFAFQLARELASRGFAIVSGGARGVDTAAHRGALDVDGATWVVCPTGHPHLVPPENEGLFHDVARSSGGRLVWPFADGTEVTSDSYLARNSVLVALAEAVVVIQARRKSGSTNAATWATRLRRPLWMTAAPPWSPWPGRYDGSFDRIRKGEAKVLTSPAELLASLGLEPPMAPSGSDASKGSRASKASKNRGPAPPSLPFPKAPQRGPDETWSPQEIAVFPVISFVAKHQDELAVLAGLPINRAVTALLTLSSKDVVVEGPNGFFRRKNGG